VTGRRWPGRVRGFREGTASDQGSFTAELAAGLPALMLLLLAGLTAVSAVTAKAQCADAAREGALATARGDAGVSAAARVAPPGAAIEVVEGGDAVTVRVRASVRLAGAHLPAISVRADATAAREPDTVGSPS
jgi:hypothetical protein